MTKRRRTPEDVERIKREVREYNERPRTEPAFELPIGFQQKEKPACGYWGSLLYWSKIAR